MSYLTIPYIILINKVKGQIEQLMKLAVMMDNLGDTDESIRLTYLAASAQVTLWQYEACLPLPF